MLCGLAAFGIAAVAWSQTPENAPEVRTPASSAKQGSPAVQPARIPPLPPEPGSVEDAAAPLEAAAPQSPVVEKQPAASSQPLVTVVAAATQAGDLLAQQPPKPPDTTPSLPPTKVIGEPQPSGTPADQFSPVGPPGAGESTQGYIGPPGEGTGGRGANLIGSSPSASQGTVSQSDIQSRPAVSDQSQLLESVPGIVAATHSGSGHAPDYFLRGFSLEHGTDFASFVDGVPVNLRTNPHGQGYMDLNFLIPEVVRGIDFYKGPYYPEVGDFSNVGYANFNLAASLPNGFAKVEGGQFNWWRYVMADSPQVGPGILLYAFDARFNDGPYTVPENLRRWTGIIKYTVADDQGGLSLSFLGYNSYWNENYLIPNRAVVSGLISRFGSLDPSDFGNTNRYTGNLQFWEKWDDDSITKANIYLTYYDLNLTFNSTFFLDDPVNGDQLQQLDKRWLSGFNLSHEIPTEMFGLETKHIVGLQVRQDWIPTVALNHTVQRGFLNAVAYDNVSEFSGSAYYKVQTKWADKLRTMAGFRGDYYNFTVDDQINSINSGNPKANIFSPKGSVILGPWAETELYLNAGMSFHSNDARGVTQVFDPTTGQPTTPVPALVQGRGAEVGYRTKLIPNLTSTAALWYLELDSELVFDGESATTEPSPASHRYGIEWSNYYALNDWLSAYADYSNSYARFVQFNEEGQFVPNAVETVVGSGIMARARNGMFASLSLRHFGPRPLTADNSVRSGNTSVFNLRTGWDRRNFSVVADFLNLFNSRQTDAAFFYATRLPGEPAQGVNDINFHPVYPFAFRVSATYKW